GHDIGACGVLQLPVPQPERPGLVVQLSGGGVAAPVGLDGLLQFASQADAGKAQIAYGGHVRALLGSWSPPRAIRSRADTREGTPSFERRDLPAPPTGAKSTEIALRPRQVFGLVDAGRVASSLLFAASRAMPSAYGEGRFHIPLRGSAGFDPWVLPASLSNISLYQDK